MGMKMIDNAVELASNKEETCRPEGCSNEPPSLHWQKLVVGGKPMKDLREVVFSYSWSQLKGCCQ